MDRNKEKSDGGVSGDPMVPEAPFLSRLLMLAAPACPAVLAMLVLVPAILHISHVDALFVAQAEALAIVPFVVLIVFGAKTLPRSLLAGFSAVFAAIILLLPYLAFGAPG
ncbi:hypothetical protein GOB93_08355 [Acetobacter musti]|uniref:Uncharacterized protein n=1 Tax=Acetobacter musti TaxID=864732 RepID=A0ABX0JQ56_9PROT|nr:hypothetical protein [Acetobacter musti]NHN84655.1 hypothetical protein [Acetobacter musti]